MSATPLVDRKKDAFFTDGNVTPGKYNTYNEVVNDLGGYFGFTAFNGLKDAALQFAFGYLLFVGYIQSTFDTTLTSGLLLYALFASAGDEQYITIIDAAIEWLCNCHTMYRRDKEESQFSFRNITVTGFSTAFRTICMLGGAALSLNFVVRGFGAEAVTKATQKFTVENSSTLVNPTNWGNWNIFLYVMFFNVLFGGMLAMYKHKINKTNFSLKGRTYSAIAVAGARANFPLAISCLYVGILRVSSPNIGDPIQIQIYAVFQWYLEYTNGVGAVIGGAYTGALVVCIIYWTCYWMGCKSSKDNGYTTLKSST